MSSDGRIFYGVIHNISHRLDGPFSVKGSLFIGIVRFEPYLFPGRYSLKLIPDRLKNGLQRLSSGMDPNDSCLQPGTENTG